MLNGICEGRNGLIEMGRSTVHYAGLRPSDITLGQGDGREARATLSAKVLATEIHGAEVLIKARSGASVYHFQSHLTQKPEPGETVICSYPLSALQLFDKQTGVALSRL